MESATIRSRWTIPLLVVMVTGLAFTLAVNTQIAFAQDEAEIACSGIEATGGSCDGGDDQLVSVIQGVIEILLYIVGVAAVIMLVVGGIRYVVSGGDQQAVAAAKNTIIYSIVGLIIAVLAWVAVDWVFDQIIGSGGGSGGGGGGGATPT